MSFAIRATAALSARKGRNLVASDEPLDSYAKLSRHGQALLESLRSLGFKRLVPTAPTVSGATEAIEFVTRGKYGGEGPTFQANIKSDGSFVLRERGSFGKKELKAPSKPFRSVYQAQNAGAFL